MKKPPEKASKKTQDAKETLAKLNRWNKWLAILHAVQGVAVLILATVKTVPITTSHLTVNTLASETAGQPVLATATRHLFDINLAFLVAAFFFMSALAHALIATKYRRRYESDLTEGVNKVRWVEYGLSASTMLVAIAALTGVTDLSLLLAIFGLTFIMNMMGLAMETLNRGRKQLAWLPFVIGCVAGIIPWLVIGLYLFGGAAWGAGTIPTFVYWIYGTMFVAFNCFAVNMYLQYKKRGKWADYLYGERIYMLLSLVAKTVLAWQVFAGTLRP